VLEELLDARAKLPVPAGFERLHYLLYTPFRHPPLRHGSRFGTHRERGILYASRDLATAFAEVAYYPALVSRGHPGGARAAAGGVDRVSFRVAATRGVDLTRPPFRAFEDRISSPVSYADSQRLGAEMREAGVEACLYVSARATGGGVNLAVFDDVFRPPAAARRGALDPVPPPRERVEFRAQRLAGEEDERFQYERAQSWWTAGCRPPPLEDQCPVSAVFPKDSLYLGGQLHRIASPLRGMGEP